MSRKEVGCFSHHLKKVGFRNLIEFMKIAVTYDNGNVFQHFGRTEFFKVYEVEDSKVVSSEVIASNGVGHGALAGLLSGQSVDVLICGGIGGGARLHSRKQVLNCAPGLGRYGSSRGGLSER